MWKVTKSRPNIAECRRTTEGIAFQVTMFESHPRTWYRGQKRAWRRNRHKLYPAVRLPWQQFVGPAKGVL